MSIWKRQNRRASFAPLFEIIVNEIGVFFALIPLILSRAETLLRFSYDIWGVEVTQWSFGIFGCLIQTSDRFARRFSSWIWLFRCYGVCGTIARLSWSCLQMTFAFFSGAHYWFVASGSCSFIWLRVSTLLTESWDVRFRNVLFTTCFLFLECLAFVTSWTGLNAFRFFHSSLLPLSFVRKTFRFSVIRYILGNIRALLIFSFWHNFPFITIATVIWKVGIYCWTYSLSNRSQKFGLVFSTNVFLLNGKLFVYCDNSSYLRILLQLVRINHISNNWFSMWFGEISDFFSSSIFKYPVSPILIIWRPRWIRFSRHFLYSLCN